MTQETPETSPPPKKRKKPGPKPSVNTDDAAEIAAIILGQGLPKHVARKAIDDHFRGRKQRVSARSFESILSRARELIAASAGKSRRDMRNEARVRYESIIADPATLTKDRLRAQENLDKLMRLSIPERLVISGTGEGGAIKTQSQSESTVKVKFDLSNLPTEDLKALRDMRAKMEAATQSPPPPPPSPPPPSA